MDQAVLELDKEIEILSDRLEKLWKQNLKLGNDFLQIDPKVTAIEAEQKKLYTKVENLGNFWDQVSIIIETFGEYEKQYMPIVKNTIYKDMFEPIMHLSKLQNFSKIKNQKFPKIL